MRKFFQLALFLSLSLPAVAQTQLQVMHYNLLRFGPPCEGVSISEKYNWLGTILDYYRPDIMTVNELAPNVAYVNGIKALGFAYTDAVEAANFTNQANSEIVNQLFYNSDKLGLLGQRVIANPIRDLNVYSLFVQPELLPPGADTVFLHCVVVHFKASNGSADRNARAVAAQDIMQWLSANPLRGSIMLLGDLNVYNPAEGAYQNLTAYSDTALRFVDPLGLGATWSGSSFAQYHTQSTRNNSFDCGSGGGMDDRFDMILANKPLWRGEAGLRYVSDSYAALGNNGQSYNNELLCNGFVPSGVCVALKQFSDHLPVGLRLSIDGAVSRTRPQDHGLQLGWTRLPGSEELLLRIAQQQGVQPLTLSLYDLQGRRLRVEAVLPGERRWSLPGLAPGLYLLRLEDAQGRVLSRKMRW